MDQQGALNLIARVLRGTGATCTVNAREPGGGEIEAVWEGVTTWLVQVIFSEAGPPKWPARQELAGLTAGIHKVGGLAVYVGLVRDMAGDETVGAMSLEHYPGMTEKMLERIEAEARSRWPLEASLVVHRYGRLEPGDRIVLVACTSAHRQAGFWPDGILSSRRSNPGGAGGVGSRRSSR